jgi:hypothetical protein
MFGILLLTFGKGSPQGLRCGLLDSVGFGERLMKLTLGLGIAMRRVRLSHGSLSIGTRHGESQRRVKVQLPCIPLALKQAIANGHRGRRWWTRPWRSWLFWRRR